MKLTEKSFFRFAAAVLICAAAFSAFADEATERRLGDSAFYSGDYRNAAAFYESALALSDSAGNKEAWADNALKLGYARFYDGDLEGARKILSEFRTRHPGRSAGTLPGDLLAASGKTDEAEKFYGTLISTGDTETIAAAELSRGYMRLRLNDYVGALKCFEAVSKSPSPWAKNGRLAVIYTLIRQNKISNAMIELGKIPVADHGEHWQLLRWLADLRSGHLKEIEKPLLQFASAQTPRPQPRICEVMIEAAQAAAKENKPESVIVFYERAQDFSPDNEVRREILRRLVNLYAKYDLGRAKETAKTYSELFPSAPDRAAVLISIGRLLAQNGKDADALALFQQLISDRRLSLTDRLNAAEVAVAVAEKSGRREEAEKLYQLLISESPGAAARFQWRCAYVQYLMRINDLIRAVKTVESALAFADRNEREALLMLQLEALRRSGNAAELQKTARTLQKSRNRTNVAMANFVLAELHEKNGAFAEARKYYQAASAEGGGLERPARFKAAQMAAKGEETEKAAVEFADFARTYPHTESAPAALYYAICAYRELGDPEKAADLQRQLKESYPRSEARIAIAMLNAESRAENGDAAGAAADLGQMLDELKGASGLADAMLMRMRFLQLAGDTEEALKEAQELGRVEPESAATAEALLLAGNIEFNRGQYDKAFLSFMRAENKGKNQLFREVVSGRIIDTELVLYGSSDPLRLADTQKRCQQLFTTSKNPVIRLQSRYKLGMAKERSGDQPGALAAYEQLLYDAGDLKKQGLPVSTEWCVRAANAALRLIVLLNAPDAIQRGSRLIDRYEALSLAGSGENFTQLRREFRKKIIQQNSRR